MAPPNLIHSTHEQNHPLLILGVGLLGARDGHADSKTISQSLQELGANSEAIAIVQIDKVNTAQIQGTNCTYTQKATARVERTLTGEIPSVATLLGDETSISARRHLKTGRFLVFLKHEKEG